MSDAMTNLGVPGNGITLWPYQAKAVADFEAVVARGLRHPLLVIPTGGGKTIVFCEIIKRYARHHPPEKP